MRHKKTDALMLGIMKGAVRTGSFLLLLSSPLMTNYFLKTRLNYNSFAIGFDVFLLLCFALSFIGEETYKRMSGSHYDHLDEAIYKKNFIQGVLAGLGFWMLLFFTPVKWDETIKNKGVLVWVSNIELTDVISFLISVLLLYSIYWVETMKKKHFKPHTEKEEPEADSDQ